MLPHHVGDHHGDWYCDDCSRARSGAMLDSGTPAAMSAFHVRSIELARLVKLDDRDAPTAEMLAAPPTTAMATPAAAT